MQRVFAEMAPGLLPLNKVRVEVRMTSERRPAAEGGRSSHIELERLTRIVAEEQETLNGDELEHLAHCQPCLALMRLAVRAVLQSGDENETNLPRSPIS